MSVKKKRVSKKNKIAWRKHVDITDVENFLEDQRLEERLGERTENLADDQLFQIDTKPTTKKLSNREKKRQKLKTLPKCFSLLQPLTKVPDPLIKRNRVRTREERRHPIAKKNEEKRRALGILTAKEKQVIQNREYEKKKREKLKKENQKGEFSTDVWQIENTDPVKVVDKQWLTNDTLRHNRQGLGKLRKEIPKSLYKKPVIAEAVEAPHPGTSYNPSLKDHLELLKEVADVESQKIKKEKHIDRVTTKMFARVTPAAKENSWLVEMSEGLPNQNENSLTENDDGEFKSINPPVLNKKKDQKQKRKQKEQKQLEKLRLDSKIEKKKIADIYKLKKLNQVIEKHEKKSEVQQKKKVEKKEKLKYQPRNLSKHKFESPDLEFSMGYEISGNLKNLKVQGNLLKDRFTSLQKRSILQPTIKAPPRKKAKYKKYERESHKMGWESKGF